MAFAVTYGRPSQAPPVDRIAEMAVNKAASCNRQRRSKRDVGAAGRLKRRTFPKCNERYVPITNSPTISVMKLGLNPTATECRESRQIPTRKLKAPQRKFAKGEESPIPLGLAKGVGNGRPRRPLHTCGMQLQRKAPAKKRAT